MNNNIKLTKEWVQKGRDDLRNAKVLLEEGGTAYRLATKIVEFIKNFLLGF